MADPFAFSVPPDRSQEAQSLVQQIIAGGGSEADVAKALGRYQSARPEATPPEQPQAPAADPFIERVFAGLERQRQLRDIVAEHIAKSQFPAPDPAAAAQARREDAPEAQALQNPAVSPSDVLTGGLLAGGRGAVQTGIGEALSTAASQVAGHAGLPPWVQTAVGLAAGLAPLPPYGKRLPTVGEAPPRVSDALIPEVMPPETTMPTVVRPGQGVSRMPREPGDPYPGMPMPWNPSPTNMLPPPDLAARLPPSRGLPAPPDMPPPPPPEMVAGPEGVAMPRWPAPQPPQTYPMIPPLKREVEIPFFGQPRVVPPNRSFPTPGTTGEPSTFYADVAAMPSPQETLAELQRQMAALPERVGKVRDVDTSDMAKQAYQNLMERTAGREQFNPMLLANEGEFGKFQDLAKRAQDFGPENFPEEGTLSKADFASRLERQRSIDSAQARSTFGPRANVTPKKTVGRASLYAAGQLDKGSRVLTPQGPGTVVDRLQGGATSLKIRQQLDRAETGTTGRAARQEAPQFAMARTASVRVKLDNGKTDAWSAWNLLRLDEESKLAGKIPAIDPREAAKIKRQARPRRDVQRGERESAAERAFYAKQEQADADEIASEREPTEEELRQLRKLVPPDESIPF